MSKIALIIGAGKGISGAFALKLKEAGWTVALSSRTISKLVPLAESIGGADVFEVDCSSNESIVALFCAFDSKYNAPPDLVLYNTSGIPTGATGTCGTVDYTAAAGSIQVTAIGAMVAAHEAGKRMLPHKKGAIFFTGATAGVKAFPTRGVFAMGKHAMRGLAQSLYKELSPQGIHVVHFIIDGGVSVEVLELDS
jgi:NAD(P)-dependent dehydrogenase (short-subunit alcohol dehydrogenase family)